ncbi:MAG: TIGR03067 domain-containing protein [Isosphaeraceae bacterium]
MLNRLTRMGLTIAASLAVAAGMAARADEKTAEKDLKKLDGEWIVKSEAGGEVHYTFKGDKLKVEAPSRTYEITVKIDPDAKPEKTMDMHIDEAPEDAKGKTSKAIYKWEDDDTFVFCMRAEGDRPTKYEQIGFEQILTKLKRKKS